MLKFEIKNVPISFNNQKKKLQDQFLNRTSKILLIKKERVATAVSSLKNP